MTSTASLKRLLYKELRESWLIVFVLFVMPAVAVTIDRHGPRSQFVDGLVMFTSFLMPVLMVTWAVTKSDVKLGGTRAFSGALPVNPLLEWVTSTLLPVAVVLPLGIWVAAWFAISSSSMGPEDHLLSTGLWFTAIFTVALAVTRLTSIWAGLGAAVVVGMLCDTGSGNMDEKSWFCLIAIVAALGLSLVNVLARKRSARERAVWSGVWVAALVAAFYLDGSYYQFGDTPWYSIIVIVAGLGLSLVSAFARNASTRARVAGSGVWLLMVAAVIVGFVLTRQPFGSTGIRYYERTDREVLNSTCTVTYHRYMDQNTDRVTLTATSSGPPGFEGAGSGVTRTRVVPDGVSAVAAAGDTLYLIWPGKRFSRSAKLVACDLRTDTASEMRLPAQAWAISGDPIGASLSDDGAQMLIPLPSLIGDADIWLIDLKSGRKRLCAAGVGYVYGNVGWTEQTAFISSSSGIRAIDRQTGRMTRVKIAPREAFR